MRGNETTILKFIGGLNKVFIIPPFQRNYEWTTEQCDELFNDLLEAVKSNKNHYLGNIIYYEGDKNGASFSEYILVDGQQRVTTILLLLCAIRDMTDDEKLKRTIGKQYLKNEDADDAFRVRLKQTDYDEGCFSRLVNGTLGPEETGKIYDNYKRFRELIADCGVDLNCLFELIPKLEVINDLDILNTSDVTLTGGECFLVKDFQRIALTFLNHGINLWIMTNGILFNRIKTFVQATKDYNYSIKVSLDGLEKTHNKIRQKETAFNNVIKSLDFISAQSNIKLYISTVIMKDNLEEISKLKTFVENRYPKAIHSVDFIFASGNAKHDLSHCFSLKELQDLSTKYPMLFVSKEKNTNIGFYRCSAGISQATLKADGTLKICNIANDDIFYFKHNVFKKGLKKTWEDCGANIEFFRKEERKNTSQCKHCPIKSSCNITDCRVFAKLMTESEKNSSPISCLMARKTYETTIPLL